MQGCQIFLYMKCPFMAFSETFEITLFSSKSHWIYQCCKCRERWFIGRSQVAHLISNCGLANLCSLRAFLWFTYHLWKLLNWKCLSVERKTLFSGIATYPWCMAEFSGNGILLMNSNHGFCLQLYEAEGWVPECQDGKQRSHKIQPEYNANSEPDRLVPVKTYTCRGRNESMLT